jgi:hypothetical protein
LSGKFPLFSNRPLNFLLAVAECRNRTFNWGRKKNRLKRKKLLLILRRQTMPKFPTKETDVVALVNSMIAGYTVHPADFPSITAAKKTALQTALTNYLDNKKVQEDAQSQAQIATVTKTTKLDDLVETMKSDLKLSEVDCTVVPEKLSEIGWAPRQIPQPVDLPGQPTELHSTAEGQGLIWLEWTRPLSGGAVRNYVIQRRQQPQGGGEFGSWTIAGTALEPNCHLTDQPRGVQLEFRVNGANISGEGEYSNTLAVVL